MVPVSSSLIIFKTDTLVDGPLYFKLDVVLHKLPMYKERDELQTWINENTACICDEVINIIMYGRYLWTEGGRIDAEKIIPCYNV